jgi:hypothetical protein
MAPLNPTAVAVTVAQRFLTEGENAARVIFAEWPKTAHLTGVRLQ